MSSESRTGSAGRAAPAAVALALLCLAAPAGAALPDDLRLDGYPGVILHSDPQPNPHAALPCERCHTRSEGSYEIARRFGVVMPLVTEGENPIVLCDQCHPGAHPAHDPNLRVERLGPAIAAAGVFPLLRPVEGYERMTCTTCHAVHFPHTANRLLRGFPVDRRTGGSPFGSRLDFCAACHGDEEVRTISGHFSSEGSAGCGICHEPRDIAGRIGPLLPGLNATCSRCHPDEPGQARHFYRYNPFPEIGREELDAYGVALAGGRFTCATCHVHHAGDGDLQGVKPGFVAAARGSLRVNPHATRSLCVVCHPVEPPPPGTPGGAALVEGEQTPLCRRCHAREGALRMVHPLVPPSDAVPVAAGWPLRPDGALGCETCHLPGHAPRDPENPRFLRGGPYRTRSGVCFRCHREGELEGRDPHRAAGKGECGLCHEVTGRSELNPEGKAGALLAEPNLLCLRCHSPPRHPAASEHTVLLRERSFVVVDRETIPTYLGKITCDSCHDSHAASGGYLLRADGPGYLCTSCHPF